MTAMVDYFLNRALDEVDVDAKKNQNADEQDQEKEKPDHVVVDMSSGKVAHFSVGQSE